MINAADVARTIRRRRAEILGYVSSTASLTFGLVAQTIAFVVLARVMGAKQCGELSLVMTYSSMGLIWCGLCPGEMLRRRTARSRAEYPYLLGHALLVLVSTSIVIGLATSAILTFAIVIDPDPTTNFLVILALVVSNQGLSAWISLAEYIYLAHDNYAGANMINIGAGLVRAALAIVACLAFGVNDLATWSSWLLMSSVITAVACAFAIAPFGAPRYGVFPEELARGTMMCLSSIIAMFRMSTDVMALGAVASPEVVGIYSVARRIVTTAAIVTHSFDRLAYSRLAIAGRSGPAATYRLACRFSGLVSALSLGTSVAIYLAAPLLVPVFGEQYAAAVPVLKAMCWTLWLTGMQFLAMDAINAADRQKARLITEGAASVVCMATVALLTYAYELNGLLIGLYLSMGLIVATLWATLLWLARRDVPTELQTRPLPAEPVMR